MTQSHALLLPITFAPQLIASQEAQSLRFGTHTHTHIYLSARTCATATTRTGCNCSKISPDDTHLCVSRRPQTGGRLRRASPVASAAAAREKLAAAQLSSQLGCFAGSLGRHLSSLPLPLMDKEWHTFAPTRNGCNSRQVRARARTKPPLCSGRPIDK